MKLYKQIIFILIVFFKTETLFSENSLFSVNNIELEKKDKTTNKELADQAIKKGFNQLISRILLNKDNDKFSDLSFSSIKRLVKYYRVASTPDKEKNEEQVNFSVTFDKEKMHNLFYKRGISYSEITDKEIYILPVLIKNNEIFIFNNNFFYKNWNEFYKGDLIEFILPIENIEIIRKFNQSKNNLIDTNINNLFKEYSNKNFALVLIEDNQIDDVKIYIKTIIQGKNFSKSLKLKKELITTKFYEKIIIKTNKELINLIKSKNLIDVRTPFFLNAKFNLNKKNNLVELNSNIKQIDSIENVNVQEFNKDYMKLRIKYLGNLEKIINQLKKKKIDLHLVNDEWILKTF